MLNSASTELHVKHHTEGRAIPEEMLFQIPDALRNPILIIKGKRDGSLVIISDTTDSKSNNLLFAVTLNVRGQHGTVNCTE